MPKPPPYNNPHSAVALARAARYLGALFKPKNYVAIMNSLEPVADANAFKTACGNAHLTDEETDWLWNYLQHCNQTLWTKDGVRDDPDLANVGW